LFDLTLIVVLGSGVYLWLSRRKTPIEESLDRLVLADQAVFRQQEEMS